LPPRKSTERALSEVDRARLARMREAVDVINRRIRDALDARLKAARVVAAWKEARGVPLKNAAREREMLSMLSATASAGGFGKAARDRLFRAIFAETRAAVAAESDEGSAAR
jgi:chorismate mutase